MLQCLKPSHLELQLLMVAHIALSSPLVPHTSEFPLTGISCQVNVYKRAHYAEWSGSLVRKYVLYTVAVSQSNQTHPSEYIFLVYSYSGTFITNLKHLLYSAFLIPNLYSDRYACMDHSKMSEHHLSQIASGRLSLAVMGFGVHKATVVTICITNMSNFLDALITEC